MNESNITLKYGNDMILDIIKRYPVDYKYHFESESGPRDYTLIELKEKVKNLAKSYLKDDYDIVESTPNALENACNSILTATLELTCKNLIIPDSL